MEKSVNLFPGSVIALLMGVCLASPLIILNIGTVPPELTGPRPEIGVDVAYVYIDILSENQNITGLWRDYNNSRQTLPVVAVLFVLNITNYSDVQAEIDFVSAMASKSAFDMESFTQNGTITANYPIVRDSLMFHDHAADFFFDNILEANQSRLIALSGIQIVQSTTAFEALKTGEIVLQGQSSAKLSGASAATSSGIINDIKQVQLEISGSTFVYN